MSRIRQIAERVRPAPGDGRVAGWLAAGAATVLVAALLAAFPDAATAQAEALGQQRLGRAYWHVFLAYAIGWVLILGWVVSIARRLGRVEASLSRDAG